MKKSRFIAIGFALVLVTASIVPILLRGEAGATGLVTAKSIQLSSSTPGATGVTYNVTITPATTQASTAGIIIDFCSDSPVPGASCAFAATTVPNVASAGSSTGTFATVGSGTPVHTVKITALSLTSGTPFNFQLTNMTNPSTATTFYARILTYASAANAGGYVPANTTGGATTSGTFLDSGGDALSTANSIGITATIAETLTFCTSGTSVATCGSATAPGVTLGSGSPPVLGTSLSTANNYTVLSTNAVGGAVIAMKISTSCGGLSRDGGATCPIAAAGATAITIAASAALFGAAINTSTGGTGASVVPSAPYDQGGVPKYGMDTTGGVGVTSTYGDTIASASGPVSLAQNTLTFAADTSAVTPAGVYTATALLIATGTF